MYYIADSFLIFFQNLNESLQYTTGEILLLEACSQESSTFFDKRVHSCIDIPENKSNGKENAETNSNKVTQGKSKN